MSAHETARQLQIVKTARDAGGYANKQTNAYTSGILDLKVIISGFAPVDIEVKDLKDVGNTFKRKVDTTPLQKDTLKDINAVHAGLAFVMVTYKRGATIYVAYLSADETHVTQETSRVTLSNLRSSWPTILTAMGVPRI